jgi:hypothetical protein
MIDEFYLAIKKAEDIDAIEGIIDEFFDESDPVHDFNINKIPEGAPINPELAYIYRKIAIEIKSERQLYWQNYWFRCCISEKCNYIFSILKIRNVDREDDLRKICNPGSKLWKTIGDKGMEGYLDVCIDFFLRRYNWPDAFRLYWRYSSKKNTNLIKLFFPRMLSAILVGFLPILTSQDLRDFAEMNQSNLFKYSIAIVVLSVLYLLFECHITTQRTLVKKLCKQRIFPVLAVSLSSSLIFSYVFMKVGLLGTGEWCWSKMIFYAMFALFIGILVQLIWEEKTVTEPL